MQKCLQYLQAAAMVFALGVLIQGSAVYAEAPPDSDGDGVSDAVDQCPQEPGPARFQGCDPCDDFQRMAITGVGITVIAGGVALAPVPGARAGAGLMALIGGGLVLAGMVGAYLADC